MGKLKEQIKRIDLGLDALNNIMQIEIFKIVDEMRKEFPLIINELDFTQGCAQNPLYQKILEKNIHHKEKWFQKWLSE